MVRLRVRGRSRVSRVDLGSGIGFECGYRLGRVRLLEIATTIQLG